MGFLDNLLRVFSKPRLCVVRAKHVSVTGMLHEADKIPNQDKAFEMLRPDADASSNHKKRRHLKRRTAQGVFAAGVFDGHGAQGEIASSLAAEKMQQALDRLLNNDKSKPLIEIVREVFKEVAKALNKAPCSADSGTTGSLVIVRDDDVVIANVGDSSVILVSRPGWRGKEALRYETRKHRPTDGEESNRILGSGGFIQGEYVVDKEGKNGIAVSRTLGDRDMQQYGCISDPEIRHFKIRRRDTAILLASDGLWDVPNLDFKQLMQIVSQRRGSNPQRVCENLLKLASAGSRPADDCTIACLALD